MSEITTVNNLLTQLSLCENRADYVAVAKNIQLSVEDFSAFQFWSTEAYTRNCIAREAGYELLLLCWEEGQGASVHCHGGEDCWVHVVEGELREKRFELDAGGELKETNDMTMSTGELCYMNDDMGFHSIKNVGTGRAMSLHLYAEPIESCRVYNTATEEFKLKVLKDTSYGGVRIPVESNVVK